MALRIKKEDTVVVLTGKEKNKRGRVIAIFPKTGRLLVERVNMIKKHMKPNQQYKQGGIIEMEASLESSNVMLVCPKCDKPSRVENQVFEDGKKHRVCKKCKEVMDN